MPGGPAVGGASPVEIARLDVSRAAIFEDYYRPATISSFDEILSHPFVSTALYSGVKAPRHDAPDGATPHTPASAPPPGGFEGVPGGAEGGARDGRPVESELWAYDKPSSMLDELSVASLGVVQLMLPQGYTDVDEWARRQDGFHEHAARAGDLYAAFLSNTELATPLGAPEELDVYSAYLTGHVPAPLPSAPLPPAPLPSAPLPVPLAAS